MSKPTETAGETPICNASELIINEYSEIGLPIRIAEKLEREIVAMQAIVNAARAFANTTVANLHEYLKQLNALKLAIANYDQRKPQ